MTDLFILHIQCEVTRSESLAQERQQGLNGKSMRRECHFYVPTISSIYDKYKERGGRPVFKSEDSDLINDVWSSLMETASSDDYMRDMKINQHLSSLITLIMSESWHPEDQVMAKKKQSTHEVKKYGSSLFQLDIQVCRGSAAKQI